ncbi:MAG TPA: cytochrome c oxidase assembly protein [Devosia sp.]|jgi:cytochrome c oxidase assembly protein subunit 11|nr:cytochrome c oxidase assembly protein [Devosia sp.]
MTNTSLPAAPARKNRNIGGILFVLAVVMVGAAYAAVPLYYAFCAATGYGGTTRNAAGNPKGVIARQITVRFDANVDDSLPWQITPAKPVTDRIGSVETILFTARNLSDHAVTGQAAFNVTPDLAGSYFNKIQCFCFTQQTLKPGETVQMPVTFFVDPDIDKNSDLSTVSDITLSYTFYASKTKGS